ncbi:MAG TPA: phosphonate C-P lyase system protein PhnK [Stellaceae bacterium]|jgi:putative phosphonate transport system ATP-binding protein|nr:phosphonate C-P lyase system protein PhnK [Stellaceae bacterium]
MTELSLADVTHGVGLAPLLRVAGLAKNFGERVACRDVSFEIWRGEVLGVVGESGSGKTTLLNCLSTRLQPDAGRIEYRLRDGRVAELFELPEPARRLLMRTDWGFVHQKPRDGLRLGLSAGANIGERLMAIGERHYGDIRSAAVDWLAKVEIEIERVDEAPLTFSGGMQQRLQIARNLVSRPRLVFMDEPTGGLDVSVQARLLDLLRGLCDELGLAAIVVTHDLGVARLLAHRLIVMRGGAIVETGLTDQVLDDPQHPYTQLLVSSMLQ